LIIGPSPQSFNERSPAERIVRRQKRTAKRCQVVWQLAIGTRVHIADKRDNRVLKVASVEMIEGSLLAFEKRQTDALLVASVGIRIQTHVATAPVGAGRSPGQIPGPHLVYGFLTTTPNAVVAPIHPKTMPVILTTNKARCVNAAVGVRRTCGRPPGISHQTPVARQPQFDLVLAFVCTRNRGTSKSRVSYRTEEDLESGNPTVRAIARGFLFIRTSSLLGSV